MNKASGGDGIPVELFQILEDDAVKGLHSIYIPKPFPTLSVEKLSSMKLVPGAKKVGNC